MFYEQIPSMCNFHSFYDSQIERCNDGSYFVEVGTYLGSSAFYMAERIKQSKKKIKFDCIDYWDVRGTPLVDKLTGEISKWNDTPVVNYDIEGPDAFYNMFMNYYNSSKLQNYLTPIRLGSMEASELYEDKSLDFVYIDAEHSYDAIHNDIKHWIPKIKPGGVIAGHDYSYNHPDVKRAVNEFFGDKIIISCDTTWSIEL